MPDTVSIIVPIYNRWDLVHARMNELHRYCRADENLEIILVDDASTDMDIRGGVAFWQKQVGLPIRFASHKENRGFGATCNDGVRIAKGEIIALLSDDVVVQGNFIDDIRSIIAEKPRSLIGGEIIDFPGGWNEIPYNGGRMVIPYCNGWFLACKKSIWEELGGFDPLYGRFDMEDVDISTTAHLLGIELISLHSRNLHHLGGISIASLGVDRLAITKKNREKYLEKWMDKTPNLLEAMENGKR